MMPMMMIIMMMEELELAHITTCDARGQRLPPGEEWDGGSGSAWSRTCAGCTRYATPPTYDGEYIRHWLTYVTRWSKASPPERVKRLDAGLLIADDRVLNTSTYHSPTPGQREPPTSEPSTSEPSTSEPTTRSR
ncbi:GD12673 [Drosophila simulans]|uniref:GD12673 n=1 Tax=Drosophila simulans TaxID=7240 RepID=B4QJ01_DROSI|nr:GD12673 [Drosophila simulans]